jgi:hypothetical protein
MHAEPELLALLALGEHAGTESDRVHVQTCRECAEEVSELRQVVTLARSEETTMALPSQEVWVRIREELGFDLTLEPPQDRSLFLLPDPPEPSLVTGLSNAIGWSDAAPGEAEGFDELTAHAQLRPVGASWSHASGMATLATDGHGRRVLEVALQADLPTVGVRQAWLIHRDDPSVRQTLGILDGPFGLWTVAHSIDLEQYAILDISQQGPGEVEHSGQTIVRGQFALVS